MAPSQALPRPGEPALWENVMNHLLTYDSIENPLHKEWFKRELLNPFELR